MDSRLLHRGSAFIPCEKSPAKRRRILCISFRPLPASNDGSFVYGLVGSSRSFLPLYRDRFALAELDSWGTFSRELEVDNCGHFEAPQEIRKEPSP